MTGDKQKLSYTSFILIIILSFFFFIFSTYKLISVVNPINSLDENSIVLMRQYQKAYDLTESTTQNSPQLKRELSTTLKTDSDLSNILNQEINQLPKNIQIYVLRQNILEKMIKLQQKNLEKLAQYSSKQLLFNAGLYLYSFLALIFPIIFARVITRCTDPVIDRLMNKVSSFFKKMIGWVVK